MPLEVKLIEWFNEHWYKISFVDGGDLIHRFTPSVTTKLGILRKPFLEQWRGDLGNEEANRRMRESQDRGSRIHHAWWVFTGGGAVIYNPWRNPVYTKPEIEALQAQHSNVAILHGQDEMLDIVKLKQVVEIAKPTFLFSEKILYSLKNNDAGSCDNAWFIKGGSYKINGSKPLEIPEGNYIVDLKTGNSIDDAAHKQTAAYLKMAEEMELAKFAGTIILHTGGKTKSGIEGLSCILRTREQVESDYKRYRLAAALWESENQNAAPRILEFPSLIKMN